MTMKASRTFPIIALLAVTLTATAQDYYPTIEPVGIFLNHDGEEEELTIGN